MSDQDLISRFGYEGQIGLFSFALYLSYALTVFAIIGSTILPVLNAIRLSDTKSLIKLGAIAAIMAVMFLICWGISSDEVTKIYANFGITAGGSKAIGGGIIMTYVFTIATLLGIVYTEVTSLFK
ncbi:MAG: hypothetical protein EAZ97_06190 [Bacteroidetes bacterium]|nr:MAG: hypothetical protein EAZ97_06190 [Bacteroidota bacterium]